MRKWENTWSGYDVSTKVTSLSHSTVIVVKNSSEWLTK